MSKHTAGPWKYDGDYVWADSIGGYVANPQTEDMTSGKFICTRDCQEIIDANARLIAAAPELLEALEGMLEYSDLIDVYNSRDTNKARAAVWKARGIE